MGDLHRRLQALEQSLTVVRRCARCTDRPSSVVVFGNDWREPADKRETAAPCRCGWAPTVMTVKYVHDWRGLT